MQLFFPRLDGNSPLNRQMLIFLGISFAGHLLIIGLVILMPFFGISEPRINTAAAIQVDLVAFNPEIPQPPAQSESYQAPATPQPVEPVKEEPPPQIKEVPVPVKEAYQSKSEMPKVAVKKPEPKIKTSMKKKSFDAEKAIEKAVSRIEAESEKSRPKSVSDRIAELKREVGRQPLPAARAGASKSGGSGGSTRDFSQMEIYQAEVSIKLKNNWVFSENLAGDTSGLESRLVIKILPDGSIADVWFEKKSGNAYLDESAYKTVMKSNPLPRLPEGHLPYHLVLIFTPSGIASDAGRPMNP